MMETSDLLTDRLGKMRGEKSTITGRYGARASGRTGHPFLRRCRLKGGEEARRLEDISSLRCPFNIQASRQSWHLAVWDLPRERCGMRIHLEVMNV